ncbi:MAG TPA: TetR/AcrR family transcriptional regulator [Vicinamibacterales bacterium]|jgi:AcrR family transcriptional regulator
MTTGESAEPVSQPRPVRRRSRRARASRNADTTAATRIDILKSAAKAFRRLGYHGATVENIAAALRMKKGNLYYYFKNKEEILFWCHQYSLDRLLQLLDEVERSGLPPAQKLRALIIGTVHMILDELHGTALILQLEALSPVHLKEVIVRRDLFDRGIRQVLEEGIADGSFSPDDVKLRAFALLGAVNWIPRWFNPAGSATSSEIADRFADYLIAGLRR